MSVRQSPRGRQDRELAVWRARAPDPEACRNLLATPVPHRRRWWEQLRHQPHLRDLANWPAPVLAGLSPYQLGVVLARRRLFEQVLSGVRVTVAALEYGVAPTEIYRLLGRALGCKADEKRLLPRGWIPTPLPRRKP